MQPNQQYAYPPQYAPPPPQAPTAPAPQPAPASTPLGFQDPTRGGVAPSARHLLGRTIMIVPKRVDETSTYGADKQSRPTAYFDLYVVDGGEIVYGDSEDRANPRPPTHKVATPAFFRDAMSGNVGLVNEVRTKIGPNGQATGIALGVMEQGTRGNRPFLLTKCEVDVNGNDRPDGAARRDAAQRLYFAHTSGQWTPPQATPLAQAPPPQVAYAPNYGQPAQSYGPTNAQAGYTPGQYAPPPQAAPMTASYPAASPAQAGQQYPPPPGWEDNPAWGNFSPEQQAQVWAQFQAAQAPQAPQASQGAPPPPASAPPSYQPPPAPAAGPGW